MASPSPAPRAAAAPAVVVAAVGGPPGPTAAVEAKALGANLGRTHSQSTMPYAGSRGGRFSTPIAGGPGPGQVPGPLHTGGSSAAPMHPGQRTPPWGGCAAAGAAAAGASGSFAVHAAAAGAASAQMVSPTRHISTASVSGLRTAAPLAPNAMRGRRGSRLATALSSPLPQAASRVASLQCDGDAAVAAAGMGPVAIGITAADGQSGSALLESLCGLLEGVMKHLADVEVVRHLHSTGWLRALCHGAHSLDVPTRESCLRAMTSAARALACGGRAASLPVLTDLEADAEVRTQLSSLNPAAAALLAPRRQEPLPPRAPEGNMVMPPRGAGVRPGRPGLPHAPDTSRLGSSSDCGAGAVALLRAPSLAGHLSGGTPERVPTARKNSIVGGGVSGNKEAEEEERGELGKPAHGAKECDSAALQLPAELELVLPPKPEEELPAARRGRRRGAAASRVAGRTRKGLRPAAPKGAAPAVEAAAAAADGDAAAAAVPKRVRARKGTARRKVVRAAKDVTAKSPTEQESERGNGQEPKPEENNVAAATAAAAETAATGAPGPATLLSPLPKRRRVSEMDGDDDAEGSAAAGHAAAGAADGELPATADDGTVAGRMHPRVALFPAAAAGGASFSRSAASDAAPRSLPSGVDPAGSVAASRADGTHTRSAAGCTAEAAASGLTTVEAAAAARLNSARASASAGGSLDRDVFSCLELQLTARELRLAEAVRRACISLESALAARRHDLAAVRAADQAAAAAAAAAATMAAAAATAPEAATLEVTAAEDATGTQGGGVKKKVGRTRTGTMTAPAARSAAQGKQAAAQAAAAAAAQQPAPPATAPAQPPAGPQQNEVADEEFLSRTYRGVSKKLNFDDM